MTPDEKFMIQLYKLAMQGGEPQGLVDYRAAARLLGAKETASKNIVKHLAQANFIKKVDESTVHLTPRGCELVLGMLDSQ